MTDTIGQVPQVTSPDLLNVKVMTKLITDRFDRTTQPFTEVCAWQGKRNKADVTLDWRFTTADARIKLKKLYPTI